MMSGEKGPNDRGGRRDEGGESIEAFLPFIPVSVRNRLSESSVRGSLSSDTLVDYIVRNLRDSFVPIPVLSSLAMRSGFAGTSLILMASDKDAGPSLFSNRNVSAGGDLEAARKETSSRDDFGEEDESVGVTGRPRAEEEDSVEHSRPEGSSNSSVLRASPKTFVSMSLDEIFEVIFDEYGEKRAGQLEMARAVLESMEKGRILIVEAGTGTGKSLAYLVPAIIHALRAGKRVAVSTYTRNLQNQLYLNEVPRVKRLFGIEFDVARLMGRENYLCPRRVMRLVNRFSEKEPKLALNIALAAVFSDEGLVYSVSNLDDTVRPSSLAPPKRCLMAACAFAESCPFLMARRRCSSAEIALINHSLVFTDYSNDRAIVGEYDAIVFDEAHNLEKAAISSFSISVGKSALGDAEETIEHIVKDDDVWKVFSLELTRESYGVDWAKKRKEIAASVKRIGELHGEIFERLSERYNQNGLTKNLRTRYKDGAATFSDVRVNVISILLEYNKLQHTLKSMIEVELPALSRQFQKELEFSADAIDLIANSLDFLSTADDEDYVFWFDWDERGKIREIASSPIFVDRRFADFLEDVCRCAIFTSATLSGHGSFEFFARRLGLDKVHRERVEISIPSPFPFDENCLALVASDAGDPAGADYAVSVAGFVTDLARKVHRRMIVLFTSYRLMFDTKRALEGSHITPRLMIQGGGESRESLAEKLRFSDSGILFGVASFWEGVDFPGEELEVLVITKTPFPVPVEPIIDARAGMYRRMGEDPFEKLFLPEAILRMKQGIGRLIRRYDDRGVVIILDSRLVRKRYGKAILEEMPTNNVRIVPIKDIVRAVEDWFEHRGSVG